MFAVIVIPEFSLQAALRHEPELRSRPVALVDPELSRPDIIHVTPAAHAAGVTSGLTASQAMARCPDLTIRSRSLPREQSATHALLQAASAFAAHVEDTARGVCTMELKGLGLRFDNGSAQKWASNLLRMLAEVHLEAQLGFAVTPELAWIAARAAHPLLRLTEQNSALLSIPDATQGELSLFLKETAEPIPDPQATRESHVIRHMSPDNLPLSALDPSPALQDILHRWGIRTVGALIDLGKDRVVERLGPDAAELFDRVSGDAIRPLHLVTPSEDFTEAVDFEVAVESAEPLLFVLRRFVEQLSRRMEWVYLVVAQLQLRFDLASGAAYEHTFRIPSPTADIDTLFRMLQTHLENVRTDSPIVSLRLTAKPGRPDAHQFGLFESTLRDPNQFAETLARLTALCGPDRVGTPEPQSTYRPDVFRMKLPDFKPNETSVRPSPRPGLALRRFRPAVPTHIEFRGPRPALLRSALVNGAIIGVRGPFVSSGNWWDATQWAREEWDVETADGTLLRLFRSEEGCFMEGVYD